MLHAIEGRRWRFVAVALSKLPSKQQREHRRIEETAPNLTRQAGEKQSARRAFVGDWIFPHGDSVVLAAHRD